MFNSKMTEFEIWIIKSLCIFLLTPSLSTSLDQDDIHTFDITMPGIPANELMEPDAHMCVSMPILKDDAWIIGFEPLVPVNVAHHLYIRTCSNDVQEEYDQGYWECFNYKNTCEDLHLIYLYAKNANPLVLPDGVGYHVGKNANIRRLFMQIHYASLDTSGDADYSGVRITYTTKPQKYQAGLLYIPNNNFKLPAGKEKVMVEQSCILTSPGRKYIIGARHHTHDHGIGMSTYVLREGTETLSLISKGNPSWPQSIYPVEEIVEIKTGDHIILKCIFNTSSLSTDIGFGRKANDEMCRIFYLFFTDSGKSVDYKCVVDNDPKILSLLPEESNELLPENTELLNQANGVDLNHKSEIITYDHLFHNYKSQPII